MDFSSIPLWIQVHDLPIEYMSKENAKEIRALVGEVLDVDLTGDGKICMSMFRRDEKLTRKEPYGFGPWMKAELINKRTTRWVEFIVEAAQTLDEDGEGRSKALGQRDEVRNLHTLGDSENENRCDSSETQVSVSRKTLSNFEELAAHVMSIQIGIRNLANIPIQSQPNIQPSLKKSKAS
nr:hypothetical protein CFP56_55250 [Quercus suber]